MGNWNSSMIFASAGLMLKHVWEAAGFIPLASRGDVEVWVWKKVSTSALEHWKDQNKRELRREVILRTFLHFHLQDSSYTEYKHFWLLRLVSAHGMKRNIFLFLHIQYLFCSEKYVNIIWWSTIRYGYFPPEESFPCDTVKLVGVLWAGS